MQEVIQVKGCTSCPFYASTQVMDGIDIFFCRKAKKAMVRKIYNPIFSPTWCPLKQKEFIITLEKI